MTTPDYRALAAELLKAFDTASAVLVGEGLWDDDDTDPGYSLRSRARAALAAGATSRWVDHCSRAAVTLHIRPACGAGGREAPTTTAIRP